MLNRHQDTYKHKGLREKLIEELKEKGISNKRVLEAIREVPRHFFFDPALDKIAYQDRAFPIEEGQTISQPYTVAFQTELLQIKPEEKVLEIGTGSGYQASILAAMGARVYTIERHKKLFDRLQAHYPFKNRYPHLRFFYGDGFQGLPSFAPFDKILVTAAAPEVPQALKDQLNPGGIMVLPLNEDEEHQRMTRMTRLPDGSWNTEQFNAFQFVPMLKGRT